MIFLVLRQSNIFFNTTDVLSSVMGRATRHTKRGERCRFHVARDPIQVNPDALGIRKNSGILTQVDNV